MLRVGAHASVAGGVHNAVDEQLEYAGNCGQIFTHSPQVWRAPEIDAEAADRFREATASNDVDPWVIHTSYLVNLCTPRDDLRERTVASVQRELDAADRLDVPYVNVHLGAHTGAGVEAGLDNAADALAALDVPADVRILIETDAGAGTKLGSTFSEIAAVVDRSDLELGVCLDTAHVFAAGYDISTSAGVDETLAAFDDAIGLERLACVHLNDSKHACGTNRDEHAHVGEGHIGEEGMRAVVNHDALAEVPFVLETPTEDGRSFAWNVARVRELYEGDAG